MQPDLVLQQLAQRIREEFEDSPDLRFTVSEAARFWGLDEMTCAQVLRRLRGAGFLVTDIDGRYRPLDASRESGTPRAATSL